MQILRGQSLLPEISPKHGDMAQFCILDSADMEQQTCKAEQDPSVCRPARPDRAAGQQTPWEIRQACELGTRKRPAAIRPPLRRWVSLDTAAWDDPPSFGRMDRRSNLQSARDAIWVADHLVDPPADDRHAPGWISHALLPTRKRKFFTPSADSLDMRPLIR
jgi:hypothetical protein